MLTLSDVQRLQRLGPDSAETLLDHHSASFDAWLFQQKFISFVSPSSLSYYFAAATLLDQLDPNEYNWQPFSVIVKDPILPANFLHEKTNVEFSRIVSKFLMDRKRAGFFWVSSQTYADLARHILEFLHDK